MAELNVEPKKSSPWIWVIVVIVVLIILFFLFRNRNNNNDNVNNGRDTTTTQNAPATDTQNAAGYAFVQSYLVKNGNLSENNISLEPMSEASLS